LPKTIVNDFGFRKTTPDAENSMMIGSGLFVAKIGVVLPVVVVVVLALILKVAV